jgi:hypothetical protein
MIGKFSEMFASKKWIAIILASLGWLGVFLTGDEAWKQTMDELTKLVMTAVGGQAVVDAAKAIKS